MEIAKNILVGIYLVICLILIFLVLSQTKEDGGASGTIVGGSSNNFYEKNKGRTKEGRIKRATITLMVLYFILTIAIGIIYVVKKLNLDIWKTSYLHLNKISLANSFFVFSEMEICMKKRKKIIGTFRANERGFGFVEFDDENEEDVFISPKHFGGALNGD